MADNLETDNASPSMSNVHVGPNAVNSARAADDDVKQNTTSNRLSSNTAFIDPSSKPGVTTPQVSGPSTARKEAWIARRSSGDAPLIYEDHPVETYNSTRGDSNPKSYVSGSKVSDPRNLGYHHSPSRRWASTSQLNTIDNVTDLLYESAKRGTWNSTVQDPRFNEEVVGLTLVTDMMDRPVQKLHRNDYDIGQILWTYIIESSQDLNLGHSDGLLKTEEGRMLTKWRPTIVIEVTHKHCLVVELGRRRHQYFHGLPLLGLMERCGVVLDVGTNVDYDNLPENHEMFRSVGKPLKVAGYHRGGPVQLSGFTVAHIKRIHTRSFNEHSLPCGWLEQESTVRLLEMCANLIKFQQDVKPRYSARFLETPIFNLTPGYRTAIADIKKTFLQVIHTSKTSNEVSVGQDHQPRRLGLRALENGRGSVIALPQSHISRTVADFTSPISESFDFSMSIPRQGRDVPPSITIQKAKIASRVRLLSAKAAQSHNQALALLAQAEYDEIKNDRRFSKAAREDLKRKRDVAETEVEVAEFQIEGYQKLEDELQGYHPNQFHGKDGDQTVCSTITSKFKRIRMDSRGDLSSRIGRNVRDK